MLAEHRREQLQRIRIVVDQEHAGAIEPKPIGGNLHRLEPGLADGRLGGQRQRHRERGASAGAVTLGLHGAAVELDQVVHDRETEAESGLTPAAARIGLAEAVEDVGEQIGVDAETGVAHREACVVAHPLEAHRDVAPRRRELHGVADEIRHHLAEPKRIAAHCRGIRCDGELHALLGGGAGERLGGVLDNRAEGDRAEVEQELAGDGPREIEQVLDEPGLQSRVALDALECPLGLRRAHPTGAEQRDPAQHRRERGPELVREHGQELVLGAIGVFGLRPRVALALRQVRTIDGEHRAVGDAPEEIEVRLREDARRRGSDVEHADERVTRAQRHPDQRAHALAQERTHDLDVGEVVEDQAARALRDAPGHAGAQRNAEVLEELLAEALRFDRAQPAPALVPQQHRGRVAGQDLADPPHQLDQELVQAELGEGVVGDELELPQRGRGGLGLLAGLVLGHEEPAQLLLDPLPLGDVHHGADHADGTAALIAERGGPRGHPARAGAVTGLHAILDLVLGRVVDGERAPDGGLDPPAIAGIDPGQKRRPRHRRVDRPEDRIHALRPRGPVGRDVVLPQAEPPCFHREPLPRRDLAALQLGAAALGEIGQRDHRAGHAPLDEDRVSPGLGQKGGAVAPVNDLLSQ